MRAAGPLAAIALLVAISADASAACVRHFYNNSNCVWSVTAQPYRDKGENRGNVWFKPTGCTRNCTAKNGNCQIMPHCSVEVTFTTTGGNLGGTIGFFDVTNNHIGRAFGYSNTLRTRSCPYIMHRGRTGNIYLNEPADGDVTFGACKP